MSSQSTSDLAKLYGYEPSEFQQAIDEAMFSGRARREATRLLRAEETPSEPRPDVLSLQDLLNGPREELTFRVKGWQPVNSRIVLAAQGKAGKSHAMHNLIRSLVDGDKWLGRWDVTPIEGNIGLFDLELSPSQLADWLEAQDIKNVDKVKTCCLRGRVGSFNILDPGCRAEWVEQLAEANIDYLIFDCLRPALDALNLDEHKDAGRFFVAFDALLKESQTREAAVVHHMGHSGERARGDSRIIDWPDANWRLTLENPADPNTSKRFIYANGRDVSVNSHVISLDMSTRRMTAKPAQKGEDIIEEALKVIESILADKGEAMTGRNLEKELKDAGSEIGRNEARRALTFGTSRGRLEKREGRAGAVLYELAGSWSNRVRGGHGTANYEHEEE